MRSTTNARHRGAAERAVSEGVPLIVDVRRRLSILHKFPDQFSELNTLTLTLVDVDLDGRR